MKHILVYGDSISWGLIPGTRKRLDFHMRWPGLLEAELNSSHRQDEEPNFRVIENCLNGRRTASEDPI